jgi:hypothetical protein
MKPSHAAYRDDDQSFVGPVTEAHHSVRLARRLSRVGFALGVFGSAGSLARTNTLAV